MRQKLLPNDEKTLTVLEEASTNLILCGHTHKQGKICYPDSGSNMQDELENSSPRLEGADGKGRGRCILNPGSVGMPFWSGGKAQFMFLHGENGKWSEEFISLEYDVERVIAELYEEGLFEKAPGWCKVTEKALAAGNPSHGAVLARAMELCKAATGACNWPEIPEEYWEQALEQIL